MTNWRERSERDLIKNLAVPQDLMVRGEGSYLWNEDGTKFLDFLAGIAVNSLGHCSPVVAEALAEQMRTVDHVSNYFVTPAALDLAERLLRIAAVPEGGRVFLSNSGTEAVEAAFKLVRLWGNPRNKTRVLAFEGAFHGRTMGALALTAKAQYRDPFAPGISGVEHVPLSVSALEEAMGDDVAAIFVEPIQGEAGVVELPEGLLRAARDLADAQGALLIFDEVQTGAGRTGKWFAFQHTDVVPDALTVAKGMGGGFPVGALIAYPRVADLFYPGSHGTTFGGNPLAANVANRVLGAIEEQRLLDNVVRQGRAIRQGLLGLDNPLIDRVRGEGLLLGVVLTEPRAAEIAARAFQNGLIINAPAPDVIRLVPPLTVTTAQIQEFLQIMEKTLVA